MIGDFSASKKGNANICEEFSKRLKIKGWHVFCASSSTNKYIRFISLIWKILAYSYYYKIAQVDVYSGRAFIWAEASCFLLRILRKPYVLILHGGNLPIFAKKYPSRVNNLLCSATQVVAPSKFMLKSFESYSIDILYIPNPINLNDYLYRIRTKIMPKLIWLRTFHNIYNPQLAVKMISELKRTWLDISLVMVGLDKGDGSLQKTQELIIKHNLERNVTLMGPVSKQDVPQTLQIGDIFINTTNVDNTPISVIEAMASGLCIVSTNVGGLPYLLEDGKDALLVEPNDPKEMAKAVEKIIKSSNMASKLSSNAREKAKTFHWDKIIDQWDTLLQHLLKE